jgi:hypothetical protein
MTECKQNYNKMPHESGLLEAIEIGRIILLCILMT